MAKSLKINIKNTQIAGVVNLASLKSKLAKQKAGASKDKATAESKGKTTKAKEEPKSPIKKSKARTKSSFSEKGEELSKIENSPKEELSLTKRSKSETQKDNIFKDEIDELNLKKTLPKSSTDLIESSIFKDEKPVESKKETEKTVETKKEIEKTIEAKKTVEKPIVSKKEIEESVKSKKTVEKSVEPKKEIKESIDTKEEIKKQPLTSLNKSKETPPSSKNKPVLEKKEKIHPPKISKDKKEDLSTTSSSSKSTTPKADKSQVPKKKPAPAPVFEKLGPTGRHVKDLLPKKVEKKATPAQGKAASKQPIAKKKLEEKASEIKKGITKEKTTGGANPFKNENKPKFREFRDVKPSRKLTSPQQSFNSRDKRGLGSNDDDKFARRRRRPSQKKKYTSDVPVIRPSELSIRVPISIKDLASQMKLKASELISKLFLEGIVTTLNDYLDDVTVLQLLGHEFNCEISIDSSEEERIRITSESVQDEIKNADSTTLTLRAPIVTFMGHVDHGKTSLIDAIRKTNITSGEAGAITQHIGAFQCSTDVGNITVLDTPGHEAFSSMRARGADVTDIVVLVIAGDEGMRQQTKEAIQHAKAAGVSILVAINKCDKPNFNADTVYRQLADLELLPEAWGGQTITVNCSAVSGEGVQTLLEMIALQAEVLELQADPSIRARGSVLESEMHKGLGVTATLLVQNGTLKQGDAIVMGPLWGRIKTLHNEFGKSIKKAIPATPVKVTGLSGLPDAGNEFVVVDSEKEARNIAETRFEELRHTTLIKKKQQSLEKLLQDSSDDSEVKVLNVILRADVQGSAEALKIALEKIKSEKVNLNIIFCGVGEISESDIDLAVASKAVIVGFHSQVEPHAESLIKQTDVKILLHNIIYHAVDEIKLLMLGTLDSLAEEKDTGKAQVLVVFKSSHLGKIAGCQILEGTIHRNHYIRFMRDGKEIWKGSINSIKREKDDVKEVQKGFECGIVLQNFSELEENDVLEAYEITYKKQEL